MTWGSITASSVSPLHRAGRERRGSEGPDGQPPENATVEGRPRRNRSLAGQAGPTPRREGRRRHLTADEPRAGVPRGHRARGRRPSSPTCMPTPRPENPGARARCSRRARRRCTSLLCARAPGAQVARRPATFWAATTRVPIHRRRRDMEREEEAIDGAEAERPGEHLPRQHPERAIDARRAQDGQSLSHLTRATPAQRLRCTIPGRREGQRERRTITTAKRSRVGVRCERSAGVEPIGPDRAAGEHHNRQSRTSSEDDLDCRLEHDRPRDRRHRSIPAPAGERYRPGAPRPHAPAGRHWPRSHSQRHRRSSETGSRRGSWA